MTDRWLSIKDAAERVKRSTATIYRWADQELVHVRLGRIAEAELLEADKAMRQRDRTKRRTQVEMLAGELGVDAKELQRALRTLTGGRVS